MSSASSQVPGAGVCDAIMEEYLKCVKSKRGLSHVDDCGLEANRYKLCVQKEGENQRRATRRIAMTPPPLIDEGLDDGDD